MSSFLTVGMVGKQVDAIAIEEQVEVTPTDRQRIDYVLRDEQEYTAVAYAEANNHCELMDWLVRLGGRGHGLSQRSGGEQRAIGKTLGAEPEQVQEAALKVLGNRSQIAVSSESGLGDELAQVGFTAMRHPVRLDQVDVRLSFVYVLPEASAKNKNQVAIAIRVRSISHIWDGSDVIRACDTQNVFDQSSTLPLRWSWSWAGNSPASGRDCCPNTRRRISASSSWPRSSRPRRPLETPSVTVAASSVGASGPKNGRSMRGG